MTRPEYVAPVARSLIVSMNSDAIAKKEYDRIRELVENRFIYVFLEAMDIMHRKVQWFDYDNEGGEYRPGFFDPVSYSEKIVFVGDVGASELYQDSVPTAWLSEDFEESLREEVARSRQHKSLGEKKEKEHSKAIRQSIRQKLTKEELAHIQFK